MQEMQQTEMIAAFFYMYFQETIIYAGYFILTRIDSG